MPFRRSIVLLAAAASLFLSLACDKQDAAAGSDNGEETTASARPSAAANAAKSAATKDSAPPPAAKGGGETPEAAFALLKKGANGRDYRTFFSVLTTESQDKMLAGMIVGATITLAPIGTKANPDKKKELDAIFSKHGLGDDVGKGAAGNPVGLMQAMSAKLAQVKDRAGLFVDLFGYLEKNKLAEKRFEVVSLQGLKVSGDTAAGTAIMKGRTPRPVKFRKVDDLWYVHIEKW